MEEKKEMNNIRKIKVSVEDSKISPANKTITVSLDGDFSSEIPLECIDDFMVTFLDAETTLNELSNILLSEILAGNKIIHHYIKTELERIFGGDLRYQEKSSVTKELHSICHNLMGTKPKI